MTFLCLNLPDHMNYLHLTIHAKRCHVRHQLFQPISLIHGRIGGLALFSLEKNSELPPLSVNTHTCTFPFIVVYLFLLPVALPKKKSMIAFIRFCTDNCSFFLWRNSSLLRLNELMPCWDSYEMPKRLLSSTEKARFLHFFLICSEFELVNKTFVSACLY